MKLHISKVSIPSKETHYRYVDYHYEDGVVVRLLNYYSVRETNCYHYVIDAIALSELRLWNLPYRSGLENCFLEVKKVRKSALRSYCYESRELALHSFSKRKMMQVFHAKTAISKAELCLEAIESMTPNDVGGFLNCGLDEHLMSFIFD